MDIIHALHKKQYETTDFDRQVKRIDEGLDNIEEYFVDKYCSPILTTLEIGTGAGRIAFALEKKLFKNIVAIDFVDRFIAVAKQKALAVDSNIKYYSGDALNLPFEDESFDQVLSIGVVISHLPRRKDRIKSLLEIYRVIKPNGIMLINALNITSNIWRRGLKYFMKIIRLFSNSFQYEDNSLPRLGIGGKIDFLFFLKKDKPCIHYYYPVELVIDILSAGFYIIEILSDLNEITKSKSPHIICLTGDNIYIAARKPKYE